jgi:hypothetical protein
MAAGHQEGDTGGAEDWDFGCHDDTDNVSNLSAASKIKFHLHKRVRITASVLLSAENSSALRESSEKAMSRL